MTVVFLLPLYFVQGLPFGFQAIALPIFLRQRGVPLEMLGFLILLSLPWMAKPLWAPLIDALGISRRTWIVVLQSGLALTIAAAAAVDLDTQAGLYGLLALVFVMNVLAATQDIAVDGLAVDLLKEKGLGAGNGAQVVGYKLGMLVGGSGVIAASAVLPLQMLLLGMAGLVAAVALIAAFMPIGDGARERITIGEVLRALIRGMAGSRALLLFLVTYKIGESMSGLMWKIFVVDLHRGNDVIGAMTGLGMVASICGSVLGAVLATRMPLVAALWIPAVLRLVPLGAQALCALSPPATWVLLVVTGCENLAGGALTTVVFALMMSRVDKRIGASHYSALATVEVAGKYPGSWISGILAGSFGFPATFGIATAATALVLLAIPGLRRR